MPVTVMSVPIVPGAPDQEVDAVAGLVGDVVRAADDAYRDVGDVVVRPPAVGPARGSALNAAPSRLWFSGAVGGHGRSSRRSSEQGVPQSEPLSAWPGYLSRMLIRSVRLDAGEPLIGTIGTP